MHKKSSFPADSQNMEDNLTDNGQRETLWFRIILKFNEHILLPVDYESVSIDYSQNSILPINKLTRLIPGFSIKRLLPSLAPVDIHLLAHHAKALDKSYKPPHFNNYYTSTCNNKSAADEVLNLLNEQNSIELAYMESIPAIPPSVPAIQKSLTSKQPYLHPAPSGIDACYAWKCKGGDGTGNITFIDIEQGWLEHHQDIVLSKLPFTGTNHYRFQEHGTAVLGTILLDNKDLGLKGITPRATGYVVSQ